ncbi:MAG: undecaprenyl-diphosphate phosphatase, partial [Planctomycetaceae bacterium]
MTSIDLSDVIFLGIVQGIAEFLPISSSGHLVLLQQLLGLTVTPGEDSAAGLRLNVALHCGTLLSILVVYRRDIWNLRKNSSLCAAIVVATIPIVVVGLTLKETLETAFDNPLVASCGLMVTAVVLLVCQRLERGTVSIARCAAPAALVIGLFQSLAIIPGISRSGSTIAGGL